jgi:Spherulation-specific family 4
VAAAVIVVAAVTVLPNRHAGSPACPSALIPAYGPAASVAELVGDAAPPGAPPRLVIVNPASGPGAAPQADYGRAVRRLRAAGTRVLGYVPTAYSARSARAVDADVDRYARWYGVDGVFLDEASSDRRDLPYYRARARHVRSGGSRIVVLNPGRIPDRAYFRVADVVVTFEGPYAAYAPRPPRMPAWLRGIPRRQLAHLVYAASREQMAQSVGSRAAVGRVYFTDGQLPDPWSAPPAYLREQEAAMREGCR